MARISVVTAVLNGAATLRDCLESVAAQEHPDVEHVIVDGGSTDGSVGIARDFPGRSGPGLGVDILLDDIFIGEGWLDCAAATTSPPAPALYVTATDVDGCEPFVIRPTAENLIEWLRASIAIPVGYNRLVEIGGHRFVDGGVAAPVPFDMEIDAPWNPPIVVVLTRKMSTIKPP